MDVIEGFRLSPQQRHLWSLQQAGDQLPYRAQCAVLIEGSLNLQVLKAVLRDISDRYEILRTGFRCPQGTNIPLQAVNEQSAPWIEECNLSNRDTSRQEAEIEALFEKVGRIPFDLANGPVLRISLLTLAADRHMLLVNLPSLCADAASLRILVREISRRYSGFVRCEEPSGDPSQYADLAEWENNLLESEETHEGNKHWREADGSAFRVPKFSFEKRPSARAAFEPRILASPVNLELTPKIKKLVARYDASASAFFLACWQILLWRLTGESDFVVGLACDGRTYEGLQEALGPFAKTLPVQFQLEEQLRFSEVLERTNRSAREAVEWQEYFDSEQLTRLDAEIEPCRFFPVAFEFQDADANHTEGATIFSIQKQYSCFDRFKLKLSCPQRGGLLVAELHYDSSFFSAEDVDRLAQEFRTLLESVCANPESPIADLDIVSPDEQRQLLVEFNDRRTDYPESKCIHELFAQRARQQPENVALVFQNRRLTYAELEARANQLAYHLQGLGVGAEVPVAICMDRSLEMVVGILGILKAGGAYVPLDPEYPKERIAYVMEDARAQVLLTQKTLRNIMPELGIAVVCVDSDWETIARHGENIPQANATAKSLAYVIYTSGSTGQPKGVMVEHGGLTNAVNWIMETLELSSSDRCLLKTPITFDAAGRELLATLLAGGTLIVAEPGGHRDSRYLADTIRSERISILHCVPSLLRLLVEEPAFDESLALRAVMCGGEALAPQIVTRLQSRVGAKLYNVYGPTETIIDSTYWPCEEYSPDCAAPIGRPIPNAQAYILDDLLRLLPIGVAGNLYIGGVGMARGYVRRPDLTAEKFIPDPFSGQPGARLYKTGDLALYRPDGNIEFLGRSDHQVKIRGFRIEPGEIEGTLGQHPAVLQAIVQAQEVGAGAKRLVAYVVAERESRPTASELRSFLKDKLPEHMVPAVFVLLDAFPLTANGKVNRRALPTPDDRRPELDQVFVACRTPTEELLATIWSQVLSVERVGIYDNFFQLGGHSLLATQVVSRIREAFQVEMPLRRLFEAPTVAGLAESIDVGCGAGLLASPIVPVPRDGELPLSFAQQRLWFIDQLEPGGSVYNFPAAVRLKGPLNMAALKQSLDEIVKRHEALRTTFAIVDGRPVQVIAPLLSLTLPIVDLRELPEPERESEVQRLATNEARRPFDLAEGPLVRATVLRLGEAEHVGLLTMHHIVSDGWSTGILIREMAVLYDAFCSDRPASLPELPIQYADFAHWQRIWLQDEVLDTQLAYWKHQLLGAPPLLEVLTDHPRPALQTFHGAHQAILLPKALGDALKALSRQEGVTLFMTLLAAFQLLLHGYTDQDDVVVGTPTANRNRLEIEGLIGFFVNTLVLRTDFSDNPTFRNLLRRVREVCLGAYAHQDLPFERLVEELHPTRDLSRNPLFQVMFVLQNASLQPVELPGLSLSPVEVDTGTTHFDLTMHIVDTDQGLVGTLAYNTDLFEAVTITRMLGCFRTLLEAVAATPERRVSDLPLITETERQQLLVDWNDNRADCPKGLCIHQLFEAQVARTPDATALVLENQQLTYDELNRRANQLANHLRLLGVRPELPVAICLKPSVEMVVGLLGILKAGGVYLPLDPAYPKERLAFMLEDAEVPVILTREALLVGLPEHHAKVVCLDSDSEVITQRSKENPVCLTTPENLAYVIYTSGSTGQPKGVLVSHASIAAHCLSVQRYYELDSSDKVLQFASLSFDVSLEQMLPTLIVGATLVMMTTDVWRTTAFYKVSSECGLTVLNIPTGYWQELAREWADVSELVPNIQPRVFIVGGDTMLPEFLDLWQRTPMSSIRLINAYGPTETTITATAFEVASRLREPSALHRIPIGRPLTNRETYILNKYGDPVPVGVPGELYIGGDCLARGYLKRPDLTARNFVPNPFSSEPGTRLYKTGDLARYLFDGNIEFLGRIDDQVKIRGFRIELGEIEAALRQHPAVRETVVLAWENAPGEKKLVAYVVAEGESPPTASELRVFLKERLPNYMMPAVFVPLGALPLMRNGKVNRSALPEPGRARFEPGRSFVAPRNALERQLTSLWEEVLGIRPIGVTDNFFELGGHSLAAVRLFSLIEKRLGKKVPLATVFQGATVEHLAKILHQHAKVPPHSSLVAIQPGGNRRPFFLIHPAGGHVFPYVHLAHYLGSNQPSYGLQARGLEEGQEPHARIEDMAAYYIEALRTVQPWGPYLLGGWSMGGVVALEMAQQFQAQGQTVALLALLDTRIPTADEELDDEDFDARLLIDFVRYFGLSLDLRDSLARLPKHELLERVLEHAKRAGLMPSDIDVSQAQPFIELCKADFRATQNYALHRYPGRITLFKAGQELAGTSSDPALGWSDWAAGGVDVHIVPGNHATMVYKPHVEVLAEKLRACLDQAQATEGWFADGANPPIRSMKDAI
ncbi:amino acid adenylation domain-containing protein [Candidatus Binatus sp.]|uniref:amino acid adenylation domain-containing protein n=1 Tax=Candidatus Binatus sp. TaxID=2811406 RepID=UPI002F94484C